MDNWTDLVKARMREIKLTQEKLAERIGVTQGAVGHWLRGERHPKLWVLNQILVEVGFAPLRIVDANELREISGTYGASEFPAAITGADGKRHEFYFRYPILSWDNLDEVDIAPGRELQASDYAAQGRGYWLKVESDAMTAPVGLSVPQGMLILVDTDVVAETGKLLITRSPDSPVAVFRQLIEEGGQRYLKPLNPTYPKALYTEQTHVLGVVVQALAKF
ncbi:helix-turn-helix domain-containing protein [Pseudomonas sp. P66]|uniref:Helix-turn-helix domain-containing protein n=1 Tax=Pseudomonas arcuscaelestis TaxID=2710591 RepID=A0ABS2BTE2_9PSED|nr:S24 family peptidase [Pseudomonas arcuscaelestis]MBM3104542.1 helix-turn-helix domain-containing protein [Pseudomonas arcuscaelestis]MBM3112157.1 helix-turn-helix domain-containing protein [Pseudomonas arcuscaelestis]MBM5456881.1 helix-turn-helix domain-containing protein [Pseudomonas arcuscaelestis]